MLSIPFCFRVGIINNILILVFLASFAFFSFILLIDASMTAYTSMDYGNLMAAAFSKRVEWIPNVVILIIFFGVAVLHLQYTYSLLISCLKEIDVYSPLPSWLYNRWMWILGLAVVVDLPLTFIKTITKFSRVSFATCVLILIYLTHAATYLIVRFVNHNFDPNHEIVFARFDRDLIISLNIQAFAFNCHPTVGPTLRRLINPTRQRRYLVMATVVAAAGFAYLAGGLLPYLTLVEGVTDPIVFLCYPEQQVFTIITKGLYSLFLLVTTPLILFSARFCVADLLALREPKPWQWVGLGVIMLLAAAVVAAFVESIGMMFDFLGGIICSCLLYFFPALFYLRICRSESLAKRVIAWAMFPLGVATVALSLYDTISGMLE
jgi:sodium-coupled neutral amino acid transporter 6